MPRESRGASRRPVQYGLHESTDRRESRIRQGAAMASPAWVQLLCAPFSGVAAGDVLPEPARGREYRTPPLLVAWDVLVATNHQFTGRSSGPTR